MKGYHTLYGIIITLLPFNIVEFFVVNFICVRLFTTPLIVYIWRRHGGTCKFGFEFYWDVKHLCYNHVTTS
jgi:hypothetical protein